MGQNVGEKRAGAKNPARMIALIVDDEIGVTLTEEQVEKLMVERWDELSFYAHAHHAQQYKRTT